MQKNVEIELKLLLGKRELKKLLASELLKGVLRAGSVGFELKKYIGATFLGMLPGAIAYNFLAGSFGTNKFYVAILVLLVAFGVPLVWWQRSGECKKIRERQ